MLFLVGSKVIWDQWGQTLKTFLHKMWELCGYLGSWEMRDSVHMGHLWETYGKVFPVWEIQYFLYGK